MVPLMVSMAGSLALMDVWLFINVEEIQGDSVSLDAGPITMGAYAVAVESAAAEARSFAQREGYLMVVGGGMASIMNSMISYI